MCCSNSYIIKINLYLEIITRRKVNAPEMRWKHFHSITCGEQGIAQMSL